MFYSRRERRHCARAELKKAYDVQNQIVWSMKNSEKLAGSAAARLAAPLLRTMEFEENAKVTTGKLADVQKQVVGLESSGELA